MALESLQNPLERVGALSSAGSFSQNVRVSPTTNDCTWSATTQYFVGDCAKDPVDELMYVWTGPTLVIPPPPAPAPVAPVSVRGGPSPSASWAAGGGWQKLGGVSYLTAAPTFVDAGAGAITVTGGALTVPADTDWLVTIQGTHNLAGGIAAADRQQYLLTATGAGGTAKSYLVSPAVGATAQGWSATMLITAGAPIVGPPPVANTITLTASYAGAFQAVTEAKITAVRLF